MLRIELVLEAVYNKKLRNYNLILQSLIFLISVILIQKVAILFVYQL